MTRIGVLLCGAALGMVLTMFLKAMDWDELRIIFGIVKFGLRRGLRKKLA